MTQNATDIIYDAIIVGAGYSGLAAARHLNDAGKKILVLEARDRVGGRAKTINTEDGKQWDVGASFLGKGQDRMFDLAKEFSIETYPALGGSTAKTIFANPQGESKAYSGLVPPLGLWAILNSARLVNKFENLIKTVNIEEPWKTPNAAHLDRITVHEWFKDNCWSEVLHAMMQMSIEVTLGLHPSEVSLLHAMFFYRSIESWTTAMSVENGTQSHLMVGGGQAIANKLHSALGPEVVHLGEPVTSISYTSSPSSVTITTPLATYKAKKTIVAIPPAPILKIQFSPSLPTPKQFLLQQTTMGQMAKIILTYRTPFWVSSNLRGEATSVSTHISYVICTDRLESTSTGTGPHKLLAFIAGSKFTSFLSQTHHPDSDSTDSKIRQLAIKEIVKIFGEQAAEPQDVFFHTMLFDDDGGSDYGGGGCPVASPKPGI
ncbi:hypothetical protein QBC43DRAFT_382108 [Cladorrhinum sp. PSN259]|nr:hypothetical protein QBC43DRAFT_382108 [Cladorrhinum sp. PSN259]